MSKTVGAYGICSACYTPELGYIPSIELAPSVYGMGYDWQHNEVLRFAENLYQSGVETQISYTRGMFRVTADFKLPDGGCLTIHMKYDPREVQRYWRRQKRTETWLKTV
jgi:hypothetical protein